MSGDSEQGEGGAAGDRGAAEAGEAAAEDRAAGQDGDGKNAMTF